MPKYNKSSSIIIKNRAKIHFFLDMCKKSSTFVADFERLKGENYKLKVKNDKVNGNTRCNRQAGFVQIG